MEKTIGSSWGDYAALLKIPNIRVFVLSVTLKFFCRGGYVWLLPIMAMQAGGPLFLGVAFAVANVGDVIFSFTGGGLGDKYGRKPIVLISAFTYLLGVILLLGSLYVDNTIALVVLLAATVCLYGITGVSSGPSSAMMVESVSENQIAKASALLGIVSLISIAVGAATLGLLFQRSPAAAGLLMVLMMLFGAVVLFRLRETVTTDPAQVQTRFIRHFVDTLKGVGQLGAASLLSVLLLMVLNGLGHGISGNFYAPFLVDSFFVSPATLGIIFSLMALFQVPCLFIGGWFVDKRGPLLALVIGNVFAGGFLLLFALVGSVSVALPLMIASAGLGALHGPGYDVVVARLSSDSNRATVFGSLMSVWNAMFIVGPLIGGVLYQSLPRLPFVVGGAFLFLVLFPIIGLRWNPSGRVPGTHS